MEPKHSDLKIGNHHFQFLPFEKPQYISKDHIEELLCWCKRSPFPYWQLPKYLCRFASLENEVNPSMALQISYTVFFNRQIFTKYTQHTYALISNWLTRTNCSRKVLEIGPRSLIRPFLEENYFWPNFFVTLTPSSLQIATNLHLSICFLTFQILNAEFLALPQTHLQTIVLEPLQQNHFILLKWF